MKAIDNIRFTTQKLAARLYSVAPSRADKQRGASALEYIVLAAVLIVIIGGLSQTEAADKIKGAFTGLFDSASSAGTSGGGTTTPP